MEASLGIIMFLCKSTVLPSPSSCVPRATRHCLHFMPRPWHNYSSFLLIQTGCLSSHPVPVPETPCKEPSSITPGHAWSYGLCDKGQTFQAYWTGDAAMWLRSVFSFWICYCSATSPPHFQLQGAVKAFLGSISTFMPCAFGMSSMASQ